MLYHDQEHKHIKIFILVQESYPIGTVCRKHLLVGSVTVDAQGPLLSTLLVLATSTFTLQYFCWLSIQIQPYVTIDCLYTFTEHHISHTSLWSVYILLLNNISAINCYILSITLTEHYIIHMLLQSLYRPPLNTVNTISAICYYSLCIDLPWILYIL